MQGLAALVRFDGVARKIAVFDRQRTVAFQHQPQIGQAGVIVNADAAVHDGVFIFKLIGINCVGIRSHAEGHDIIRRCCGHDAVGAECRCRQHGKLFQKLHKSTSCCIMCSDMII